MESFLPDPRNEYETLLDALQIFHGYQEHLPAHTITELQDTVARVAEAWQRCEAQRATREKEFRYHVVSSSCSSRGPIRSLRRFPRRSSRRLRKIQTGDTCVPGLGALLQSIEGKVQRLREGWLRAQVTLNR